MPKTAVYIAGDEVINPYQNAGNAPELVSAARRWPASRPHHPKLTLERLDWLRQRILRDAVQTPIPRSAAYSSRGSRPSFRSGAIGYEHDFQNSLLGSYYDLDMRLRVVDAAGLALHRLRAPLVRQRALQGRVCRMQATTDGTDNYITLNMRVSTIRSRIG